MSSDTHFECTHCGSTSSERMRCDGCGSSMLRRVTPEQVPHNLVRRMPVALAGDTYHATEDAPAGNPSPILQAMTLIMVGATMLFIPIIVSAIMTGLDTGDVGRAPGRLDGMVNALTGLMTVLGMTTAGIGIFKLFLNNKDVSVDG